MDFCDLDCKFASFPGSAAVDGSLSCRTFIALNCRKKKRLAHKNLPCREKRTGGRPGRDVNSRSHHRLCLPDGNGGSADGHG
jgi:hypothetical protein